MANGKKSFLLYADMIHTVKHLPKEKIADLFVHILKYVNDEDPVTDDMIVNIAFEPIKQSLKRDLKNWEEKKAVRSESGALGNLKRRNKDLYKQVSKGELELSEAVSIAKDRKATKGVAKVAVNVSDSVNVSDNVKGKKKTKKVFTPPTLEQVTNYFQEKGYTASSASKAFNYYESGGRKDSRGNQVKSWKQKMVGVRFKDENKETKNDDFYEQEIGRLRNDDYGKTFRTKYGIPLHDKRRERYKRNVLNPELY